MSCSPYGSDAAHEYYAPSSPPDHAYTPTAGDEDFKIEYPPRAYDAARSAQSRTYHNTADDYGKYDDEELNQRALWSPDQYGAEPRDGYYCDDRGSFEYSLDKDCIYGRDVDKKRRQQQFGTRKDESSYDYSLDDDRPYSHSLDDDKYAYNSDREDYYEDKDGPRRDHYEEKDGPRRDHYEDKDGPRRDHYEDKDGPRRDHRGSAGDHHGFTEDHRGSAGDHQGYTGDHHGSTGDHRGSTEDRLYDYDDDDDKHQQHDRKPSDVTDPHERDDRYGRDSPPGRHEYNRALESRDGYDSAYEYSTEKECGVGGESWSDQHKDSDRRESNTGYCFVIFCL